MRSAGLKGLRRLRGATTLGGVLVATALAGCTSGDSASSFLVAPGKYVLYNCTQLAEAAETNSKRQRELEMLMTKAGPNSGGALVSSIAYEPEYAQLRGEMNELRKTAADKNCKFVPAAGSPAGRTSDTIVR